MKNSIKIIPSNKFVWRVLTAKEAIALMEAEVLPLYALHEDDTESLVLDMQGLDSYLTLKIDIGIEVGFANYEEVALLKRHIKQHDFNYGRSDDMRVYKNGRHNLAIINDLASSVDIEDYKRWWNRSAPENQKI